MKYHISENLELVPVKHNYKWIAGYITILASLAVITMYLLRPETCKVVYRFVHPNVQNTPQDIELSEEGIVKCLHEHGCVLPNIAVAQAKLESNLGKSNVGKKAKNMFGIVHHKCRYVSGKFGAYAKYETYQDNIKCYIHIQDNYLKNIDGIYAEDNTYVGKLKSLK